MRIVLLLSLLWIPLAGAKDAWTLESPVQRVSLLELFTSEGCSSCPPADRWLSDLTDDPRLWSRVVPVAFHVDYWNYLGWTDRFADARYSARQREYARRGDTSGVYTPGWLVDGQEWRGWFRRPDLNLPEPAPAGLLNLTVDDAVQARFRPLGDPDLPLHLHLAVLGFDLNTPVAAGENRGRELQHDFVVLGYARVPLQATGDGYGAALDLPDTDIQAPRRGLAAWVTRADDSRPLQAVGGWWPEPD